MRLENFNINDSVIVTLRDRGAKMLNESYERSFKFFPAPKIPEFKAGGTYRMQMHECMFFFGPLLVPGTMDPPIETEIKIEFKE